MYDASVPVFQRYLTQLDHMLGKAQKHLKMSETELLRSRLTSDMFPLWQQVMSTVGFSLRACAPLAGLDLPDLDYREKSLSHLHQDIQFAQKFLARLTPEQFIGAEEVSITHQAGLALLTSSGNVYLYQYALPNFFFHLSCVYAILRQQGVTLGKNDFDGFHQY